MSTSLHYWLFLPEVWIIAGILLVALEFFDGNMIALPLGLAALLTGGLVHAQQSTWLGDVILFETWRDVGFGFAVLAVVSVGLIRIAFQRHRAKTDDRDDINEY